jgi:hypothetical protein
MARRNHGEHARVTAICVNLALDGVEADIRDELEHAAEDAALALRRVLERMKQRRVADHEKAEGALLM